MTISSVIVCAMSSICLNMLPGVPLILVSGMGRKVNIASALYAVAFRILSGQFLSGRMIPVQSGNFPFAVPAASLDGICSTNTRLPYCMTVSSFGVNLSLRYGKPTENSALPKLFRSHERGVVGASRKHKGLEKWSNILKLLVTLIRLSLYKLK